MGVWGGEAVRRTLVESEEDWNVSGLGVDEGEGGLGVIPF